MRDESVVSARECASLRPKIVFFIRMQYLSLAVPLVPLAYSPEIRQCVLNWGRSRKIWCTESVKYGTRFSILALTWSCGPNSILCSLSGFFLGTLPTWTDSCSRSPVKFGFRLVWFRRWSYPRPRTWCHSNHICLPVG